MRRRNRTVLRSKLKESLKSVLPITVIVFAVCFTFISIPTELLAAFAVGAVMLFVGMALFNLGADRAMSPVGEEIGSSITKTRKLWFIILVCFLVGTAVTVSEPDLQVLAGQIPAVENSYVIIISVAVGVGIFLVVAMLRILFGLKLSHMLIFFYAVVFILSIFVPDDFLAVAFDAGGVTTGPMTVPFIMALGAGVASIREDGNAESDSFGLVALSSVGPIITVMILGIIYGGEGAEYVSEEIADMSESKLLAGAFLSEIPAEMLDVAKALLPIMLLFLVFQIFRLRLERGAVIRILIGFVYTYVGLVLFLTGVNVGFSPVGTYIGEALGSLSNNWIVVPIGMIIGYFVVSAEPAVHVLNKQVYEMTSGTIPKDSLSTSLSISVALSVGLSMLRIILDIPIMYFLLAGYIIALALTFVTPPIFTAIAFDSGGVASGPMTATFLLPMSIGVCSAVGGDVVTDAFGIIAMVAMTPLITIQLLGIYHKFKSKRNNDRLPDDEITGEGEIIEMKIVNETADEAANEGETTE